MDYENHPIPEGINVSEEHPLKEFLILALGLGAATVALVVILSLTAGWLVKFIPFETELLLANKAFLAGDMKHQEKSTEEQQKIQIYLQQLANQLAVAQQLPAEMSITVHYLDNDTINAFASLGGNVIMFRGLLEKLPHENALAMVMAHEIAHIKHRDPLVAAGRGITVGLALACLAGFGDSGLSQQLLGQVGLFTSLSFSRSQEEAADEAALDTLNRHYGHVNGAEVLFEVLQQEREHFAPPVFLSTHPVTDERINAIESYQNAQPKIIEDFTDLPELFKKVLE